jgi:hypothetical protein
VNAVSTDYQVTGKPSPLRGASEIRQETAEATKRGAIPPQNTRVGSEASQLRAGERLRHARPINCSAQPPVSGGGGWGGVEPVAAEDAARREYAGRRPHGARRRRGGEVARRTQSGGGIGLPVDNRVFSSSFLLVFWYFDLFSSLFLSNLWRFNAPDTFIGPWTRQKICIIRL